MKESKGNETSNIPQLIIMAVGAVICLVFAIVLGNYMEERRILKGYAGMRVTWYGDSLTQQYFHCAMVDEYFGFNGHNSGINDTLITYVNDSSMCVPVRMQYGEVDDIAADSDIIFVMGGINDWLNNMPLGDVEKAFEDTQNGVLENRTFAGACNQMFYYLREMYPDARIIVLGTTFASAENYKKFEGSEDNIHNELGLTSVEYGDVLCETAGLWDIDNINVGRVLVWDDSNVFDYCPDGIHFSKEVGAVEVANSIIRFIKDLEGVS